MLDSTLIRSHFPALSRAIDGQPLVYFDGPGGTQVTQSCIDAMTDYLTHRNANHGGAFTTSVESDAMLAEAHAGMADFLNARYDGEVIFGQNMTTLTFALSRSIGQILRPGDEIVLTRLDHDANFAPWQLMAMDRGVMVRTVDINEADCTLKMDDYARFLNRHTKLVAVGYASNAVGTINPVKQIAGMARTMGALTFVDAVHYAPHGPIDVQDLGCDFLACSPYKFFAPHLGALYGRAELLEALPAYKVRPADSRLPHKFETGTLSHESIAGLTGTLAYLEWLGSSYPSDVDGEYRSLRSLVLHQAMASAQAFEHELKLYLLDRLQSLPRLRIYGITDPERCHLRAPTFAIRIDGLHPKDIAQRLASQGICVWDGNYYAINLTERLGLEDKGGMVRIGLAHYNTREEVDRLIRALADLTA